MIDTPFSALVSLSELDSLIFQKKSRLAVLMSDLLLLETRVSGIKHEIKQELEAEGLKRKELHSLEMDAKNNKGNTTNCLSNICFFFKNTNFNLKFLIIYKNIAF